MTPYHEDPWLTVYLGDCREVMAQMEPESVHCVVTSPPYWGLRDYGTATWVGGDEACDHERAKRPIGNSPSVKSTLTTNNGKGPKPGDKFSAGSQTGYANVCPCGAIRQDAQLGLEPTPEQYVENMVAVFREVRRVLRSDGTVWLNLGDSYAAGGPAGGPGKQHTNIGSVGIPSRPAPPGLKPKDLVGIPWRVAFALQADGWVLRSEIVWSKPNPMPESVTDRPTKAHEQMFLFSKGKRIGPDPTPYDDIPDSDARWLAGILDTEGSIVVRREAAKGNDYGQHSAQVSVGNTSRILLEEVARIAGGGNILERGGQNAPMHYWQVSNKVALGILRRIYPFLIVKQRQARCAIALEEGKTYTGGVRLSSTEIARRERLWQAVKSLNHFGSPDLAGIPEPVFGRWTSQRYYFDADAVRETYSEKTWFYDHVEPTKAAGTVGNNNGTGKSTLGIREAIAKSGRNIRTVWTIATQPYPGAHFATFPRKLVEPCIKAGTSERGVCPECGAPWERVVAERNGRPSFDPLAIAESGALPDGPGIHRNMGGRYQKWLDANPPETTGWRPSCAHGDPLPVPATVLDPFAGSGTTGMVAQSLSRRAVLIDLNGEYLEQVMDRNRDMPLGLGA